MAKRIIFLDIDGTLTVAGSNVPPKSALQAIQAAQDKGHQVFLCTGRNYDMLKPLLAYGFDGMAAIVNCSDGAGKGRQLSEYLCTKMFGTIC